MANAIALSPKTADKWLDQMKPQLAQALPGMVKPEQFVRVALTTMRKNPDLTQCTPVSVAASLMTSAQLGLVCDGVLGHAYLIPFNNRKAGTKECQLVIGYKGLLALAHRSGEVADITSECVYRGDTFEFGLGDDPFIKHSPGPNYGISDGDIEWVYVVVRFRNGGKAMEVWPWKKVEAHRDKYSKGKDKSDSPWKTSPGRMGIKTVLRSMIGSGKVPVSVDVQRAVSAEEAWESQTVQGSVVRQDRPSLESIASDLLGETEEAEVVDPGELLAEAEDAIKSAATVAEAQAEHRKWVGRFSGEMAQHLEFTLASHCEYLEGGA